MLGHCSRRYPNFNPTMEWTCFLAREKHLLHPVTALVAPASQTVCQRYIRWASIKPTMVQGFVLAVLSYQWTGTISGHRLRVVYIGPPDQLLSYVGYLAAPLYMHEAFSQC